MAEILPIRCKHQSIKRPNFQCFIYPCKKVGSVPFANFLDRRLWVKLYLDPLPSAIRVVVPPRSRIRKRTPVTLACSDRSLEHLPDRWCMTTPARRLLGWAVYNTLTRIAQAQAPTACSYQVQLSLSKYMIYDDLLLIFILSAEVEGCELKLDIINHARN